jgi:hypothetical protein
MTSSRRGKGCSVPRRPTATKVTFENGNHASLVDADVDSDPERLLTDLGLAPGDPRPVLAVFGGAGNLDGNGEALAVRVVGPGVLDAAELTDAALVDGGTAAGVMAVLGEAAAERENGRPILLGVAPAGLVALPHGDETDARSSLEPNHSHFVLAPGSEWGAETDLLLRLARALSGGAPVVAVLVGGGEISKQEALTATRWGWPVFAIARTGGVADEVAARKRAIVDPEPRGLRRLSRKWRRAEQPVTDDADVEEIAAGDAVELFDGGSSTALARELAWELQSERTLKRAWSVFAGYDTLANQAHKTFIRFQASILAIGIGGTFLALLSEGVGFGSWPGDIVHWVVVAVPIALSLLIALAVRLGFGKRWVLLRGSAEAIKSEIYRFRTRTGIYADAAVEKEGLSRDEVLAVRLNAVEQRLLQTEVSSGPLPPYEGPLPPTMYGASAQDDGLSPLDAERYLLMRVRDQLAYYHPKTARLSRELRLLQAFALVAGAAGTLLAAAGFEVWIGLTTVIASAVVAYLGYLQVEPTLVAYNQAANRLEGLRLTWEATPSEKRDFERLVAGAEAVLATELSGWVEQMNQAIEEAARGAAVLPTADSARGRDVSEIPDGGCGRTAG